MKTLSILILNFLFIAQTAVAAPQGSACANKYKTMFSKSTVKIRVVFGYKDARPARFVGDRHERLAFVERILSPCVTGQACGFVRSASNTDLFAKKIIAPGGREVKVLLWVVNSSVDSDDQANRLDPFQNWQTHYAQAGFYTGLEDADVVFYNGHSRFGGGPDFGPPKLDRSERVNAAYYLKRKPGLNKLIETLEQEQARKSENLKVLGLFSCSSSQHFNEQIRKHSRAELISSRNLVYYADAIENSLSALSSVLEARCLPKFN